MAHKISLHRTLLGQQALMHLKQHNQLVTRRPYLEALSYSKISHHPFSAQLEVQKKLLSPRRKIHLRPLL